MSTIAKTILHVTVERKKWGQLARKLKKFPSILLIHPNESFTPTKQEKKLSAIFLEWSDFKHQKKDNLQASEKFEAWLLLLLKVPEDLLNSSAGVHFELDGF
ncbi:MAG: hypothetical protein WC761_05640 [Candidatus Paceibacterota bacterium]|jgi:hypothetical protein